MNLLDYGLATGRRPSFDTRGNVRGFRSRAGAPQAAPPQGLNGGSMSNSSWMNTFRNTGPAVQQAAFVERAQMPGAGMFGGMNQPVINEFMSQSQNAVAAGMFGNPLSAPFGAAMMGGSRTPTATATPAFDQDKANMMRGWLQSKTPQWQMPTQVRQDTAPSTVMRSIPNLKPGDYAFALSPNTANRTGMNPWNRVFMNG